MKKKVLYCRISTLDQRTDRQRANEKDYDLVIEDKVSGAIPFFERSGGKEILKLIEHGIIGSLHIVSIDRLGRNLRDILNTIHFFTERKISLHFISQGIQTLDENGKENPITQLIIATLGIVGQMELSAIRERQLEGVRLAKLKGVYQGRQKGAVEDTLSFLSKPKNKKALDLLKKGYKGSEVATLCGLNPNTITKIKKLGMVANS
ncbi:MAG: recombinase family protein [Chitinophagaceae bacterium]|nr:MAG: recombinase family protein [Chitinophagaceae bacterium]